MVCTKKPLLVLIVESRGFFGSANNASCLDNAFVCIQSLHLRIPPRVLHFSAIHYKLVVVFTSCTVCSSLDRLPRPTIRLQQPLPSSPTETGSSSLRYTHSRTMQEKTQETSLTVAESPHILLAVVVTDECVNKCTCTSLA